MLAKSARRLTISLLTGLIIGVFAPPATAADYIALGDSFAAGEGVPVGDSYEPNTNVRNDHCHRSFRAYAQTVAKTLGMQLSFHACSGGKTSDYWQANQHNPGELVPQRNWLGTLASVAPVTPTPAATTRLVTASFGGNDAGFSLIIKACAAIHIAPQSGPTAHLLRTYLLSLPGVRGLVHLDCVDLLKRADTGAGLTPSAVSVRRMRQEHRLARLFADTRRLAPSARVLTLGYPLMFPARPPALCQTGIPGFAVSRREMNAFNDFVADLDEVVKREAALANVDYVDVRHAFAGHSLCESRHERWINTLHVWRSGSIKAGINESFHPNARGQHAFAQRVLDCYTNRALCAREPASGSSRRGVIGAYEQAVLVTRPKAFWPLDDPATSRVARDAAGRDGDGLPGRYKGSAQPGVPGPWAGTTAASFDGSKCSGVDLLPHADDLVVGHDFALEAWIRLDAGPEPLGSIFKWGSSYSLAIGQSVISEPGVPVFTFLAGTGYTFALRDDPLNPPNTWHHLVVTRSKWLNFYVDGRFADAVEDSEFTIDFPLPTRVGIGLSPCPSGYPGLQGSIAQVAIYNHALDPATIAEHSTLGGLPAAADPGPQPS